jgi:hypothetical protein
MSVATSNLLHEGALKRINCVLAALGRPAVSQDAINGVLISCNDFSGLFSSIFVSKIDHSIYLRQRHPSNGRILDICVTNQDCTFRSDLTWQRRLSCDVRVGSASDVQSLGDWELSPLQEHVSAGMFLHRCVRHGEVTTVEFARTFSIKREQLVSSDVNISAVFGSAAIHVRVPPSLELITAWATTMTIRAPLLSADDAASHIMRIHNLVGGNLPVSAIELLTSPEAVCRARSGRYQDGRLSWPVVVGAALFEGCSGIWIGGPGRYHPAARVETLPTRFALFRLLVLTIIWFGIPLAAFGASFRRLEGGAAVAVGLGALSATTAVAVAIVAGQIKCCQVMYDLEPAKWSSLNNGQLAKVLQNSENWKLLSPNNLRFTGLPLVGVNEINRKLDLDDIHELGYVTKLETNGAPALVDNRHGAVTFSGIIGGALCFKRREASVSDLLEIAWSTTKVFC